MKFSKKLAEVADKIELKLSKQGQSPIVSQTGTTELFFGDGSKQQAFNSAIQTGSIARFLTDIATKTQKTSSFELKISAEPKKGAAWILRVTPPTLQGAVSKLLDAEFRKITGKGMADAQKFADASAKAGGGSGTLDVGSFSADID
jgi:hypothetical protein